MQKLILLTLLAQDVTSLRRHSRKGNKTSAVDCTELSDLTVFGKNVGSAVSTVCGHWPSRLGEFPVSDVSKVTNLMKKAFGPGGLYSQIRGVADERGENSNFCWKGNKMRTIQESLVEVDAEKSAESQTNNMSNTLIWHRRRRRSDSNHDNCEMVTDGICYGACPSGYHPSKLKSYFAPVCTSTCSASTHTRSCGFGCASSRGACFDVILEQVKQVAVTLGQVAGFLTGNPKIDELVDKVLSFAEFVIGTLIKWVKAAKSVYAAHDKEEGIVVLMITIYQSLEEIKAALGEDIGVGQGMLEGIFGLLHDVTSVEMDQGADVDSIAGKILDSGDEIMAGAFEAIKPFVFPKCQLA